MVKMPCDFFKRLGAYGLLITLAGVAVWGTIVLAAPGSAHVGLPASSRTPSACDLIKGKTYIAFTNGRFDTYPDAAAGGKWIFDDRGHGTGRSFIAYEPTAATGTQQLPTATCSLGPHGVGQLNFKVGDTSAGVSRFWPYDNGARLWVEPTEPGRPMNGWLLQLPPPPSRIQ